MAASGGRWNGGKFSQAKRSKASTAEKNYLRTKNWGG